MENKSDKKPYEKPIIAKSGEFGTLTGGVLSVSDDILVGRRALL